MKNLLLTGLLLVGISLMVAQTPRLSLYEEFTGETCLPCASTNPGLNALLALPTNTPKIVAIKWQVPIPSAPTNTWSLYKTNHTEIDWRWRSLSSGGYGYNPGITGAPSSKIDGQEASVFGASGTNPGFLTSYVIATAQSYTTAFSVTMNRAWDATFSAVNLTVNITASANFNSVGPLVFRTVMVEKHIHFATQPGTNGETDFEDVAIKSFPTLQGGVSLAGNWTLGQSQTFTLNCPLPSYVRDMSQVAFAGFIQDDGNQKVIQAVRVNPEGVTNDAKAFTPGISVICNSSSSPTITVENNGSNPIMSFDVNPSLNGTAVSAYNWSGTLVPGASTNIVLSSMTILPGVNDFSYTINNVSGSDHNLSNNDAKIRFVGVLNYQTNPVAEGFTGSFPPADFTLYNTYNGPSWSQSFISGGFGLSTQSAKLEFYSNIPDGAVNEMYIPAMHVGTLAPTMWFDVAYAQYSIENDKLQIMVSDNCGASWTSVYLKAGASLATSPPVVGIFTPGSSQWRTETISLSSYANKDIIVKFVGTCDHGNDLYVDNINLKSCLMQTVTASCTNTEICSGETTTITAGGATTYSWSSDPQVSGQVLVVSPATTQTFVVMSTESCKETFASIVVNVNECTGIAMLSSADLDVSVYPNPSKAEASIKICTSTGNNVRIAVVNTLGQLVYKEQAWLASGSAIVQLDVKGFAEGIYTVIVDTEKGSTVKKLTVNK